MRVWIDLSNSRHPLLFGPIARELEREGHTVLVTARDNAQTRELAHAEVIRGASPSRTSYAQIFAARSLGIRTVTAMDYKHQPVNHLAFRLARRIVRPEAFPGDLAGRQGARERKLRRYAGFKAMRPLPGPGAAARPAPAGNRAT